MWINIEASAALVALLLTSTVLAGSAQLLEQLRIDYTAMDSAERDYRSRRESGTLTGAEASDYAAYLAKLIKRVAEDCVALARSGTPMPSDIDCPSLPQVVTRSAPIDQGAEQTHAERIAALDAELNSGLGEFDDMLLREQERVKAAAPRTDTSGGTGQGDSQNKDGSGGGAGQGDSQSTESGGQDGSDAETGEQSSTAGSESGDTDKAGSKTAAGSPGPGSADKTAARGQPPGTPDGSDDDLVARQLREAAEKETDPELKKKLWEEYRKYKQGAQ